METGIVFLNFYTKVSTLLVKHGSSKTYSFPLNQQLKMPVPGLSDCITSDCGAISNNRPGDVTCGGETEGCCLYTVLSPNSASPNLQACLSPLSRCAHERPCTPTGPPVHTPPARDGSRQESARRTAAVPVFTKRVHSRHKGPFCVYMTSPESAPRKKLVFQGARLLAKRWGLRGSSPALMARGSMLSAKVNPKVNTRTLPFAFAVGYAPDLEAEDALGRLQALQLFQVWI